MPLFYSSFYAISVMINHFNIIFKAKICFYKLSKEPEDNINAAGHGREAGHFTSEIFKIGLVKKPVCFLDRLNLYFGYYFFNQHFQSF